PVTALTLLADRTLYGRDPRGFHRTVWLLHGLCAGAVFLLGIQMLKPHAAALGASLFAVFPLSAEPVGWIAGRSDVLATLLAVLATILAIRAQAVAVPSGRPQDGLAGLAARGGA